MSTTNNLARLIAVCSKQSTLSFDRHQIPIHIDENLIVIIFLRTFLGYIVLSHLDETSID